jgi:TRAP-type uncharacterized transport system fused permease subunit
MDENYFYIICSGIVMVGVGCFLVVYGVKGGLIEKKILINGWTKQYALDHKAVRQGWFYIVVGVIIILIYVFALLKTFK